MTRNLWLKYYVDGAGAENELDEERHLSLQAYLKTGETSAESDAQQNGADRGSTGKRAVFDGQALPIPYTAFVPDGKRSQPINISTLLFIWLI